MAVRCRLDEREVKISRAINHRRCCGTRWEGVIAQDRVQLAVLCCAVLLPATFGGSLFHAQSRPDVAVRIENASEKDFDGVVVKFPEQQENYGRIPAASVSSSRTVTKAYPSAFVEITLGDEVAVVQLNRTGNLGEQLV
jgi:hypothetical protein